MLSILLLIAGVILFIFGGVWSAIHTPYQYDHPFKSGLAGVVIALVGVVMFYLSSIDGH